MIVSNIMFIIKIIWLNHFYVHIKFVIILRSLFWLHKIDMLDYFDKNVYCKAFCFYVIF